MAGIHRAGVIAAKIAAHAADRDRKLSIARTNLDWKTHLAESLDPQTAEKMHADACKLVRHSASEVGEMEPGKLPSADYCSMCGRQWCSVRINREIREKIKNK